MRRCGTSEEKWTSKTRRNPVSWRRWRRFFCEQLTACLERVRPRTAGAVFQLRAVGRRGRRRCLARGGTAARVGAGVAGSLCPAGKSGMLCATSFSTCAPFHGEYNLGSGNWRGRCCRALSVRGGHADPRGEKTVVILHTFSGSGGRLCRCGPPGDCARGDSGPHGASWTDAAGRPQAGYLFVNLGSSFLAAAAGGYVTAWVAVANPLIQVLALGIVVLAISALSALQARASSPSGANWRWWPFRHRRAGRRAGQAQSDGNSVGRSTFSILCHYNTLVSRMKVGGTNEVLERTEHEEDAELKGHAKRAEVTEFRTRARLSEKRPPCDSSGDARSAGNERWRCSGFARGGRRTAGLYTAKRILRVRRGQAAISNGRQPCR